jgi:tRNA nucleotidyltransferase (CCA-adding enzyme)
MGRGDAELAIAGRNHLIRENTYLKVYLVGGAVRDQLLGYPVKERDWVVVGATPQEMRDLGYRPVGKDFPVFLHPTTHEEYALARTERKTGRGYAGFTFYAAPDVTLEADLQRRDLTINAIAQDTDGTIIDPYGGRKDLTARVLRHVSPAFIEDPVRILRVARFAARFADFHVDADTLQLMQEIVKSGEIEALVAERVWQEWQTALQEDHPEKFFTLLAEVRALPILLPSFTGTPATLGLEALQRAAEKNLPDLVRFAALLHGLDIQAVQDLCKRYRIPKRYHEFARVLIQNNTTYATILQEEVEAQLAFLIRLDAFRRPERFYMFLSACEVLFAPEISAQKTHLLDAAYRAARTARVEDIASQNTTHTEIQAILHARRIAAMLDASQ